MDAPITHVHVERMRGDELLVTWRGSMDVIAFVSESPDDAGTTIVDLDGPRSLTVRVGDASPRPYVHLLAPEGGFVVAAERLVPLEGTYNFRDVGGYRTASGGQVRWGRVFRSDHLADLTADDLDRLGALGVRVVVDVRGPHEHAVAPSAVPAEGDIEVIEWPIGDGSVDGVPLRELVENQTIEEFGVEDMADLYTVMLQEHAEVFAGILRLVADRERHAVVYHCTAGKDRTGLATALLLGALGVDDATILDDFELTNRFRSRYRVEELRPVLAEQGIDIDRFLPLFTAHRKALASALAATRSRHGTLERYLQEVGGLEVDVPVVLREQLVTDPAGL